MRSADELRALVDDALLELTPSGPAGLVEAFRYSVDGGGKRVRPVLTLAVGEALGEEPERLLPAACAVEFVHSFSLVHDDLPALDDDDTRRGRPSTWAQFGEDVAVLTGDALLVEAFRLALGYDTPEVARVLADATVGMIGGIGQGRKRAERRAEQDHLLLAVAQTLDQAFDVEEPEHQLAQLPG